MAMNMQLGDTQEILDECRDQGCTKEQTAYILATAYWETGRSMKPVKETVMPHHNDKNPSDAEVIRRLDSWARKIGRTSNIYWREGWFGRGYVQLTHKRNYERATRETGFNLVRNPDLALHPEVAAAVLVQGMMQGWFTGRALPEYVNAQSVDYANARRVVNAMDRARDIAAIAEQYERAITDVSPQRKGLLEWLSSIFARLR
jgi:hypothetical protein